MNEEGTGAATTSNFYSIFDSIISKTNKKKVAAEEEKQIKTRVLECILSIAGCSVGEGEKLEDKCLRVIDERSVENKDIVAVCLLRLLLEPSMKWIGENPWRPIIVSFFDAQFSDTIYREKNIPANLMGHQKIERLTFIVDESEKAFQSALQLLANLEQAGAQRQKVMQAINSKVNRVLFRPFLLSDIDGRLAEIYEMVQDYLARRNTPEIVDISIEVFDIIQRLNRDLEAMGTIYCQWIKTHVCEKLSHFIEVDISSNETAKPSRLSITAPSRKYPLDEVNSNLNIEIIVNNEGPGYAYDVKLFAIGEGIVIHSNEILIGRMPPTSKQLIQIPAILEKVELLPRVLLEGSWHNFDKTPDNVEFIFNLAPQKKGIDWERLSRTDPYSLLPVDSENELVGRKETLDRLVAVITAQKPGSCIIRGQKRVGKTSIAKALKSHLEHLNYIVVYLDSGDLVRPEAIGSIANLGVKLATDIVKLDLRLTHLPIPTFTDAISPLSDFLDQVAKFVPDRRVVIIVDVRSDVKNRHQTFHTASPPA